MHTLWGFVETVEPQAPHSRLPPSGIDADLPFQRLTPHHKNPSLPAGARHRWPLSACVRAGEGEGEREMVCRGPAWARAVEGVTPVDPGVRVGGVGRLVRLAVVVWGALSADWCILRLLNSSIGRQAAEWS